MGRLGEIFRAHGPAYRARFAKGMSTDQLGAMEDIEACHTPAAGQALWRCPRCGKRHFTLLGCGNRHCPACGNSAAKRWLRKHCALLLPAVVYHLVTFTVDSRLRRTIRSHPRELLELFMQTATSTLIDLCKNPKWVGGIPGITAVLHTWSRTYEYHPHIHCIVPGGALNPQGRWVESHPKYLVPVHALSSLFRARFRDATREQYPTLFSQIKPAAWKQDWVVHSEPVGSGLNALVYLARYVYRVALSENAILHHDPDLITLRYRNSDTNEPRTLRLKPHEFLRRFLQHVLPSGFRKIRYYGLHHSSKRPLLRLIQPAMTISAGLPPPTLPPLEPPALPSCPDCDAPMTFEGRMTSSGHIIAVHKPHHRPRGPP